MSCRKLKLEKLIFTYSDNLFRCYLSTSDQEIGNYSVFKILGGGFSDKINSNIAVVTCLNHIKNGYWKVVKNNGKTICTHCKNDYEL